MTKRGERGWRRGAAALLIVAMATGAGAQDPLTTRQMEQLSPREADRVVKRDLLSILGPVSKINKGMYRVLHGVWMTGRSFGTEYQGLCQTDILALAYRPDRDGARDGDMPVRPYGMEVHHRFHLVHLPQGADAEPDSRRVARQPSCEGLGDGAKWFAAPDPDAAVAGLRLLPQATAGLKAGSGPAPTCDIKGDCRAEAIAAAVPDKLDSVETCPADKGRLCYRYWLDGDIQLTIEAEGTAETPGAVRAITIEHYIVLT